MTARLMFLAVAALAAAGAASAADPAKPQVRDSDAPAAQREMVLASADVKAPAPAADAQDPAPVKRRTARVTTCRCGGDVQPHEDSE